MRELTADMVFAAVLRMLESCPPIPQPQCIASPKGIDFAVEPSGPHFPNFIGETNVLNSGQGTITPT